MKKILIASIAAFSCVVPIFCYAQTATVAFISDVQGGCQPGLQWTAEGVVSGLTCAPAVAANASRVHSWSPDMVVHGGDMSSNGDRSELYKGILVNGLTSIAGPGTYTVQIDTSTLNGSLNILGTDKFTGRPFLLASSVRPTLAVDEDNSQFELITPISVLDSTHFIATFTKSHTPPYKIRGGALTNYADLIAAGKFVSVLGNHETGAGDADFCTREASTYTSIPACVGDSSYTSTVEYFPSLFASSSYWVQTVNGLVTILGVNSLTNEGYGSAQEQWFRSTMASCPTKWCVAVLHIPEVLCGSGSTSTYQWVAGDGVNLVVSGHTHMYDHNRAAGYSGQYMTDFITIPSAHFPLAGSCASGCHGGYSCQHVLDFQDITGTTLVRADTNSMTVQQFDANGAERDAFTIGAQPTSTQWPTWNSWNVLQPSVPTTNLLAAWDLTTAPNNALGALTAGFELQKGSAAGVDAGDPQSLADGWVFNGASSFAQSNSTAFPVTGPLSVFVVLKSSSFSDYQRIVTSAPNDNSPYIFQLSAAKKLRFNWYDGAWKNKLSTNSIASDTWAFVGFVRDASNNLTFVEDGTSEAPVAVTTPTPSGGTVNQLYVGSGFGSGYFNGKIAYVLMYKAAVDPATVRAALKPYLAGKGINLP